VKAVVVYYTRFGHNRVIAEAIALELGAEVRRIATPKEYGYPYMGFASTFNVKMAIEPMNLEFRGVDLVVLCSPVWAWKPAPPARTFLREAKLDGRKLAVCFSTGGGPSLRAQERIKQDLAGRKIEITAFGEISTEKADEENLRREARAFAGRLK
jgi:hypothetical protein